MAIHKRTGTKCELNKLYMLVKLKVNNKFKYLKVLIDRYLMFALHVNMLCKKVSKKRVNITFSLYFEDMIFNALLLLLFLQIFIVVNKSSLAGRTE